MLQNYVWGKNTESTNPIGVTVYNEIGWDIRTGDGTSLTEADNALFFTLQTASSTENQQKVWYDLLGRPRHAQS